MENTYYPTNGFEFKIKDGFVIKNNTPFIEISFLFNPEMVQDGSVNEMEYLEVTSERLKQDFLKFAKTPNNLIKN